MEFPTALRTALEESLLGQKQSLLTREAQALSERYRMQTGRGRRLLTEDLQAAAYAAVRMPATFGAVCRALEWTLAGTSLRPSTLLDAGAGTGAASFAAAEYLPLRHVSCLEREGAMSRLGRHLMDRAGSGVLQQADWQACDLSREDVPHSAGLVVASYVLGEMESADRVHTVDKLWNASAQLLLIVEPGTPAAFSQLREIRTHLLGQGAHLIAPCPQQGDCPVCGADWCHFTCRVARSKLHRQLKGGDAPFEDEKFCYLAFARTEPARASARIRRHPRIETGKIMLELCTADGLEQCVVRKRDGSAFKRARKSRCGDAWGI